MRLISPFYGERKEQGKVVESGQMKGRKLVKDEDTKEIISPSMSFAMGFALVNIMCEEGYSSLASCTVVLYRH
jgi:hypothetical protein